MNVFGKNRNVIKLALKSSQGTRIDGMIFEDEDEFREKMGTSKYITCTYYPVINEYQGYKSLQINIQNYFLWRNSMSKIKLVAMDLDNTLLDSEKQISKHTEEVLKEAIRRGVYIVPATGRIFKAIPEFLRDIPGVRYAVCCNGATVYDQKEDKIIYTNHLPKETVFSLFDILENIIVHVIFIRMGKGIWNDAILTILQSMVYQIMY